MNQNKKGNGWILCSSKSFPGKYYYFNVLNGETAWTLTENEVENMKKQVQYSTVHTNYPEPVTRPPEETNTTHSNPKTPSTNTPTSKNLLPKPPTIGNVINPSFLPTIELPSYVFLPVHIKYTNTINIPSFEVQKSNTSLVEHAHVKQSTDDDNQIIVQVHTCNDQYLSKRFTTYKNILNSIENIQITNKNGNENPFRTSNPTQIPAQPKPSFSFDKNNHSFQYNVPNTLQLTKNSENNRNQYIKNPKFVFQSKNNNFGHEEAFNSQLPTFRDVIENAPKNTTFGNGFDTQNVFVTPKGFGFHTPNETFCKSNIPQQTIVCSTDAPKKTPYSFGTLEKTIHGFGTPKKTIHGFDTPVKTPYSFGTPEKTIHGFDTPIKTPNSFGTPEKAIQKFGSPKKTTVGIDTPNIATEIETKIPEEIKLNNLPENDLRHILQCKRKVKTNKNGNENPFRTSNPTQIPAQPKPSFSFDKNNHSFQYNVPNTLQLTKNSENNKNQYIKNPKFVFQSKNNNFGHEEEAFNSQLPTFRYVIENAPKKTTFGNGFDTPNVFDTPKGFGFHTPKGFGFHTPNETFYKSNIPKQTIVCSTDAPKKTPYSFGTPEKTIHGFGTPEKTIQGFDTPVKTPYSFFTPEKTIHGFDTPVKTPYSFGTSEKTIHGFDTPIKTPNSFGTPKKAIQKLGSPKKTTVGIDTPNIATEIETKIPEEIKLNNVPENDLRNILQRKRKVENSTNHKENTKKIKPSYDERENTNKKNVTFQLNISDIESSEDFSYKDDEVLETPSSPPIESISSLRRLGASNNPWYIVVDLDILLEHIDYMDAFVNTDPLCRLLVPYSVYKELLTISTMCVSRARVISARNVLRRLECSDDKYRVQNTVTETEKLKSQKDQIQCCCIDLKRSNIHVVLVTNNDILYNEAKEKGIYVFKTNQIQNGGPKTPDVTFDIRKLKFQIPNDNCVPNSKEKTVGDSKNETEKEYLQNDQNVSNENHDQKTGEKYKNFMQNFWRSDDSDSFDFSVVSEQIKNLNIIEKPRPFENQTQKTHNQNKETLTSKFFKKPLENDIFKKPTKNVITAKNIMQNGLGKFDSKNEKTEKLSPVFKNQVSKETENHRNDNLFPIFKKQVSKETVKHENNNSFSILKNQDSKETENYRNYNLFPIFKKQVSEETKSHENDNPFSLIQNKVSKETENHENNNRFSIFKNRNSIFETDSNFMPLSSKTIEGYLKKFNIKNKMVEENLKNSSDEKICCLRQILENLADALQQSSSKTDNSRASVLYNVLQKIRKNYGKQRIIEKVIEKLQTLLYKSGCIDKIRPNMLPIEIMQAIGCGLLLVQLLKEQIPTSEHLTDIEKGLNELIHSIENPIDMDIECLEVPNIFRTEKNESRFNFRKDESEIIQYLKKHYSAWTDFDETTAVKQKPEIKIYRTLGKDLNLLKINRSRTIEKSKKFEPSAEPNSIEIQENERLNTGTIDRDSHSVFEREENDKILITNDQKLIKTETSTFFDNFGLKNELKNIENKEKTEPKVIRLFSSDKLQDNRYIVSKKTEFVSKKTEFDLNEAKHGNTFGTSESGPKVVRNIALIPKYEDLFKKSVQNGPITSKTVQNGPITSKTVQNGPITQKTVQNGPITQKTVQNGPITSKTVQNGPITSKTVQNGPITSKTVQNGPITSKTVQNGPITSKTVQNGPITSKTVQNGPITSKTVQNGPITSKTVQNGPITSKTVQNGPITSKTVQNGPITSKTVQNGPITSKTVQNGPITSKTVQNGLHNSENLSNEDSFLENPKFQKNLEINDKKVDRNSNILKNTNKNFDNLNFSILNNLNYEFVKDCTVSDRTLNDIDSGIENETLKAAVSEFFKELRITLQDVYNFIISSFDEIKKKENANKIKSVQNTANKLHGYIVEIIDKLSLCTEENGEKIHFSGLNLFEDTNEGDSNYLYITECRQLYYVCIKQVKLFEKLVVKLCSIKLE